MDDGLGGDFVVVHNSLSLQLILSGLQSSRYYRFRYAARNIIYDSANLFESDMLQYSDEITVLTAVNPSPPLNLQLNTDLRYRDALIFEWEPPRNHGGSDLQQYSLELLHVSTGLSTLY